MKLSIKQNLSSLAPKGPPVELPDGLITVIPVSLQPQCTDSYRRAGALDETLVWNLF
jgi:hypothetical protein